MKIEDVAYLVAGETLSLLEQRYHYRIPDENKREIQNAVKGSLNELLARASTPAEGEAEAEPEAADDAEAVEES
jgi:hypothetical protein